MRNFYLLTAALEYIEQNLCEDFSLEELANACASSRSNLQKLFRYAFHYSIREYVQKRRHSQACRDLVYTDYSILEIAVKNGYHSHEVFCRSFWKLRNQSPSDYRKRHTMANLYPRFILNTEGNDMRKVDISELYDTLKEKRGSHILCFDIVGFMSINDTYGYAAGDVILAKAAERIERCLADGMFAFRIGRDEFAAVTGLADAEQAKALLNEILSHNGEAEEVNGRSIPFSLRAGASLLPMGGLSYNEVLQELLSTLER